MSLPPSLKLHRGLDSESRQEDLSSTQPQTADRPNILSGANLVHVNGSSFYNAERNIIHIHPTLAVPSLAARVLSSSEPLHESEAYAWLLYTKGCGYPLSDPQPGSNLPAEYLEKGINIGDVGLITTEGKFDFLFNICLPADHPINGGLVPDRFRPIYVNEARDVDINPRGWKPGSFVVAGSVTVLNPTSSSSFDGGYTFGCSPGTGAILALPEGGTRANLLSLGDFFDCAERNAIHWYRFANRVRGRQAVNGSLYLVTGYDKASAWGTASFSNVDGSETFELKFKPSQATAREPSPAYTWSGSSSAMTNEGPVFDPGEASQERPQNQCVFLRGYRIALGQNFWNLLFHPVDIADVKGQEPARLFKRSSFVPFGSNKAIWGKLLNLFLDRGLSMPMSNDSHPSNIINRFLVEQCPGTNIVITHDDIWRSVISHGETTIPEPSIFMKRLQENYDLRCRNGTTTFSKQEPGSSHASEPKIPSRWAAHDQERRCLSLDVLSNAPNIAWSEISRFPSDW